MEGIQEQVLSSQPPKSDKRGPRLAKNDKAWEALQDEIHLLYIVEDKSLMVTMQTISEKFGFSASTRKWKMKLKEWGYEKHLSEQDMKIIVAKAERRAREEGKATIFLHNGMPMLESRIETFKKRKSVRESAAASPSNQTPLTIAYFTPLSNPNVSLLDSIPTIINGATNPSDIMQSDTRLYGVSRLNRIEEDIQVPSLPDLFEEDSKVSSSLELVEEDSELLDALLELDNSPYLESEVDLILMSLSNDPKRATIQCRDIIAKLSSENMSAPISVYRSLIKLAILQKAHGLTTECIATCCEALALHVEGGSINANDDIQLAEHSESLADLLSLEGYALEASLFYSFSGKSFLVNGRYTYSERCRRNAAREENVVCKNQQLLRDTLSRKLHQLLNSIQDIHGKQVSTVTDILKDYSNRFRLLEELPNLIYNLSNVLQMLLKASGNDITHRFLLEQFAEVAEILSKHGETNMAEELLGICFSDCGRWLGQNDSQRLFWSKTLLGRVFLGILLTQVANFWRQGKWEDCLSALKLLIEKTHLCSTTETDFNLCWLKNALGQNPDLTVWEKQQLDLDWFADPEANTKFAVQCFEDAFGFRHLSGGLSDF